jgi:hypothetical protein
MLAQKNYSQLNPRMRSVHRQAPRAELLLYSENFVLCHLGDPEFEHGLGWNPDLLLRLGI